MEVCVFNFFSEIKQDLFVDGVWVNNFNVINMSNQVVYIEGHKGVVSFDNQQICLKLKKEVLKINGQNLVLKKITASTALVQGNIKSVESL